MSNDNADLNEESLREAAEQHAQMITEAYVAAIAVAVNVRASMDGQTRPLNVLAAYAHMAGTLLAMAPANEREHHVQQFLAATVKTAGFAYTQEPELAALAKEPVQ